MTEGDEGQPPVEAALDRMTRRSGRVELRLRMTNRDPDRTMHYVAQVRAIVFDDTRNTFVVRLSDEGREVVPGAASVLPTFARIDSGGTAVLTVHLPEQIVRMRRSATPTAEVELETLTIDPGATIEVAVGWSDTAFYPDPRERRRDPGSVATWERGQARVTIPPRRRR
ncbi:MAG: hypothetical protein ACRC35_13270 [Angustibacter sp.]